MIHECPYMLHECQIYTNFEHGFLENLALVTRALILFAVTKREDLDPKKKNAYVPSFAQNDLQTQALKYRPNFHKKLEFSAA